MRTNTNKQCVHQCVHQHIYIYCGFDADPTGDHMAAAMIALYPAIKRLRPPAHDWNDVLKAQP